MRVRVIVILFPFLFAVSQLHAQCTTLGQTPATAFPICGNTTFVQSTVPICTNHTMNVPGCPGGNAAYADKNPFWYRFTCYQTGTLGMLITPNDLGDDYDWQLFDITGLTDLSQVYTNPSYFVVANWSGSFGTTGASNAGQNNVECGSNPIDNVNTFSIMPTLKQGHIYLLMVSHFSDSQSGYKLSFGGGTAVITDPKLPDLQEAKATCDAAVITIKLNTKTKCSSLAPNGSDFTITPALASPIAATAVSCNSGFDMDSITLVLDKALPVGNYTLTIKNGTDGNTLLDYCDRDIPAGRNIPLTIFPVQPTPLDSLTAVTCAPGQLHLIFRKNIRCNSIAADGSDFIVTGPGAITVSSASGTCNSNGTSADITIKLASPVVVGGVYQIQLKTGADGNTIIDECGQETPAGSTLPFTVKDTVSAAFNYSIGFGCTTDTVHFLHDGAHGVNQWFWRFDVAGTSTLQSPQFIFTEFGKKQIILAVSNGFCSDTITQTVNLNNELKADFETSNTLCPEDAAVFKDNSIGDIIHYNWDLGNGITSILETPNPLNYPKTGAEKTYTIKLIIENSTHCFDTAVNTIKVLKTCYVAVPTGFTPNGDGLNDYLYPLNAFKETNLEFNIYNRYGQLVFHTTDWTSKWDGKINGKLQGTGTYAWTLSYTSHVTGKKIFQKGTSVLVR